MNRDEALAMLATVVRLTEQLLAEGAEGEGPTPRPAGKASAKCAAAEPTLPPGFFSPLEMMIVRQLTAGPAKSTAIARSVGQVDAAGKPAPALTVILRNLCSRGILDHDDDGYVITADFKWLVALLSPGE